MSKEIAFNERVRRLVIERGSCTIAQATSALARYIPAAQAVREAKRVLGHHAAGKWGSRCNPSNPIYTTKHLADLGRRRLVGNALSRLSRRGCLTRLAKATYGPPLPKLHVPAESA